jgi:hypothetical protein
MTFPSIASAYKHESSDRIRHNGRHTLCDHWASRLGPHARPPPRAARGAAPPGDRVLDAFDASTRQLLRPVFVQAWSNSDVEYALTHPTAPAGSKRRRSMDRAWLQRQIQHMRLSVTKKERIVIRAMVADRLLQWHVGAIKPSWFADQLEDPVAKSFAVPHSIKLKQFGRDSWGWAQVFGMLAVPLSSFGRRSPSSSRQIRQELRVGLGILIRATVVNTVNGDVDDDQYSSLPHGLTHKPSR